MKRSQFTPKQVESFWSKVDRSGGPSSCWAWGGCREKDGYGVMGWNGKQLRTNRVAYLLGTGPIPDGHMVLHICDNPRCCNPDHLFTGTNADNHADMDRKGRRVSVRGERHGMARLNADQVVEIRERYAAGNVPQHRLAAEYGVTRAMVGRIVRRVAWFHIP